MAVETAADRAVMLSVDDFGTLAVYRRSGVNYSVAGIFDNAYIPVDIGEVEYTSTVPEFTVRTADLPNGATAGDLLTVNGTQYTVVNVEPDGTGVTRLRLKAPA